MKRLFFLLLLSGPLLSFAQPLFLDSGFGNNGAATSQATGWSKVAHDLVQQPDGKLLAAGTEYEMNGQMYFQSLITRFLPNGSPDSSFGTNGSLRLVTGGKSSVEALALQPDGKIVLAGNEYMIQEQGNPPSAQLLSRPFIARLNANGTMDNTFGDNGIHRLSLLNVFLEKELAAITVLPNGKIIAGGTVGAASLKMMLICLNPDGTYSNTFGTAGMAQYTVENGQNAILWDMAVQNDGKIVLAGTSSSASLASSDDLVFAMTRVNADGTLDASFGTQGGVITQVSPGQNFITDIAHKVTLLPDGRICLAGTARNALALARYHINGTPDLTFGQNGTVLHEQHPVATGLVSRNGKLYTSGSIQTNSNMLDIAISAFNADGSPDITFATNGMHTAHIYDRNYTHALLLQSDGKLVTGGSFNGSDDLRGLLLTRFTSNTPTSIKTADGQQVAVTLYPNPVSDLLILTFGNAPSALQGDIHILNVSGQIMYSGPLKGGQMSIPVNHLAAGVYAVRVTSGTEAQTVKFVKK